MSATAPQFVLANKLKEHRGNIQQFEDEIVRLLESILHPDLYVANKLQWLATSATDMQAEAYIRERHLSADDLQRIADKIRAAAGRD